jgi:outer membrane protein OmpA-like peptidoglycan-associated protein
MRSRLSKRKKLRRSRARNLQPELGSATLTGDQSGDSTPLFLRRRQGDDKSIGPVQRQSGDEEEELAQTKLSVDGAGDEFEKEADQVSDHVMHQPPAVSASSKTPDLQTKSATPVYLQRMCSDCEEEEQSAQPGPVQAKSKKTTAGPASRVASTVAAPAAGKALSNPVRNKIEPLLGHDMKHVRVHDDASANRAAESLNARAFTHQNHIYLGEHENPGDLPLMAHEATHVLQQQGGLDLLQNKKNPHPGVQPTAYLQRQMDAGVADANAPAADIGPRDAGVDLPAGVPDLPTGPNACPTAEEEQEKNSFRTRFFSIERFRPSAGYGIFDASYFPLSSLMTVVSKMKFNFQMARNTPDILTLATMLANGQDISIFFWTEAQKRQYRQDYVDRVARRWSFQHTFRSEKPCWPFIAMPYITPFVVENDSDAHYLVNAYRDAGRSNFSARNPGTAGWQGSGNVDFYDVQEDPDRRSRAVARSERQRLERAINTASASPILFAQGSAALDGASTGRLKVLAELMKLKNPSDPAIPLILHGYASAEGRPGRNARLAQKRALTVASVLRAQGIPQPMVITSHGAVGAPFDASNRKVELKPSRSFETTYSTNRFGAAEHEFGHAIGLPDEYANYAPGTNLGDKQQAFIKLANQAGVAPPDRWGDSTSSMMASGVDVLPRHYLTIWEALGAMTDPHITRDEWKID